MGLYTKLSYMNNASLVTKGGKFPKFLNTAVI